MKIFRSLRQQETGFTLIELLVVMMILSIFAAIIGPKVIGHKGEAMRIKAKTTIASLETAVKIYRLHMNRYPTTDQGLASLISCPDAGNCDNWQKGGYLDKRVVPKDPWGNEFIYLCPGLHNDFDIVSYGADGASGGQEDNADIKSWEIE